MIGDGLFQRGDSVQNGLRINVRHNGDGQNTHIVGGIPQPDLVLVCLDTIDVQSQVQNGVDGVIMPLDNEGCANALAAFIQDKEKQATITAYLQQHDYGNMDAVKIVEEMA